MDFLKKLRLSTLVFFIIIVNASYARYHGKRHKRQYGAHMYLPESFIVPNGEGAGDEWSEWSSPSECSRSCGGGVSFQTRECLRYSASGTRQCSGGSRKYFSCNTQDCPEEEPDFRAQQCSRFDSVPFDGVRYEWVPYTNNLQKPCELNCMPKGERFYYRHKAKVIDGTRCNDKSLDVCVDGECQPVGCDMMLGSNAREDKCRICAGDGSSCKTISGIFETNDLATGYNDILLIPTGATNILLNEKKSSNNYLACRNLTGHYYLNGNWRIDFPRPMFFAGSWWHYERKPAGFAAPDKLTCSGPTTESIYIVMLIQDRNVGVEYEYSIPETISNNLPDTYSWTHMEYGPCSASCGGGIQNRTVTCNNRLTLEKVDESLCDANTKPSETQICGTEQCPPHWVEGSWNKCSKACGNDGFQNRSVYCERVFSNGISNIIEDSACLTAVGNKPAELQECNRNVENCPKFHIGPWTPCDKLCGEGKKKRKVTCYKDDNGRKMVLPLEECSDKTPVVEEPCLLTPCEGVDWIVSQWSGCDKCGQSKETRTAICGSKSGKVYDEKFCLQKKPDISKTCEPTKCHIQWFTSQWSECSVECGKGLQSRLVLCAEYDGLKITSVAESKCSATDKPENEQICEGQQSKCPGKWFTGPWGECSKICGGGQRTREVLCLSEGVKVSSCEESKIEFGSENCNSHPCNDDEIISVASTSSIEENTEENLPDCEDEYDELDLVNEVPSEKRKEDLKIGLSIDTELLPVTDFPNINMYEFSDDPHISSTNGFSLSTDEGSGDGSGATTDFITNESEGSGSTVSSTSTDFTDESSSSIGSESSTDTSSILTSEYSTSHESTISSDISSTSNEEQTTVINISSETVIDTSSPEGSTETTLYSSTQTSSENSEGSTLVTSILSTDTTTESSTEITLVTSSLITQDSSEKTSSEISEGTTLESSTKTTIESSTEITLESSSQFTQDSSTETSSERGDKTTSESSTETTMESSSETTVESSTETSSEKSEGTTLESSTETTTEVSTEKTTEGITDTTEQSSTETTSEGSTDTTVEISTETTEESSRETSSESSESTTSESDTPTTSESIMSSSTESILESSSETTFDSSTDTTLETTTDITQESNTDKTNISDMETTFETSSSTDLQHSTDIDSTVRSTTDMDELSSVSSTDSISSTDTSESTTISNSSITTDLTSTTDVSSSSEISTTEILSPTSIDTSVSTSNAEDFETTTLDIWSSETTEEDSSNTSPNTLDAVIQKELSTKPIKCKPRKKTCETSQFGCCSDKRTIAKGPFGLGCPTIKTCIESAFGCCPDGLSPAKGKNNKGCPKSLCSETLFGCCQDNFTPAEGENFDGCPIPTTETPTTAISELEESTSAASIETSTITEGWDTSDLTEPTDTRESTTILIVRSCSFDQYGCCPDGKTTAKGENFKGCDIIDERNCSKSLYGCCRDGKSSARGPNEEGCAPCTKEPFGCCPDKITPAHGSLGEGCCLNTQFGCCPDNINPARGPNFQDCDCKYAPYGCCPDNSTAALGYNNEGCGCEQSLYGCCPDKLTPAQGEKLEGCPCHTMQFGCCPDGFTIPQGPHHYGCHCSQTQFKCCSDEKTPAKGPNFEGCTCAESKFGCCPDGVTEAQGRKFEGCQTLMESPQKACGLPKETGKCSNFTIKYFFDTSYGACARFWYGGCDGNGNRFETEAECRETCQEYNGKDTCLLPKSSGPCPGFEKKWYFNSERERCEDFNYGGCYGTSNRFDSLEDCNAHCSVEDSIPTCEQPVDKGPCQGDFERWYFDNATDVCRPFSYGGCKGNKNNYATEHACNYHCKQPGVHKDICALEKEGGSCVGNHARWHFSESDQKCLPFYYTGCGGNKNNFYSLASCEENCPKKIAKDICEIPAEVGQCQNYTPRWYWDTKDSRCRQFYYGGCGGNGNNFDKEEDCSQRCDKKLQEAKTTSLPPPPTTVVILPPENNTKSESDKCFEPAETGGCDEYVHRWFYNIVEGICDQFIYSGCQGNGNNFASEEECENSCFHVNSTCSLTPIYGRCDDKTIRWHYDEQRKQCFEFEFSGCRGNRNNFFSNQECIDYCSTSPEADDECELSLDAGGDCNDNVLSWYYNKDSKQCEQFYYTGCDGNQNRFENKEQCERRCYSPKTTDHVSCKPFEDECRLMQCSYGTTSERTPEGCQRCVCLNPCEHFECARGEKCDVSRDPSSEEKFVPVCKQINKAEPCESYEEQCQTIKCPFGIKSERGPEGCRLCECVDPCSNFTCPSEEKCAVDVSNDPSSENRFVPICRKINKPGICPQLFNDSICRRECYDDADCRDENKCCSEGCSHVCLRPYEQTMQTTTQSPPAPRTEIIYPGESAAALEPKRKEEVEVTSSVGDIAVLRCFATGNPPPTVTWRRGAVLIDTNKGRYVLTSSGDLNIVQVHQSDSGSYVCVASNGLGAPVSREINLQVSGTQRNIPAYIYGSKNVSQIVSLKRPAVIRCLAGGFPKPHVYWWRGKKRLPLVDSRYIFKPDYSLEFRSVEISDLGPYECSAYTGHGKPASVVVVLKATGPVHVTNKVDEPFLKYVLNPAVLPSTSKPSSPFHPSRPQVSPPSQHGREEEFVTSPSYKKSASATALIRRDPSNNYSVGSDIVLICEVGGYPTPNVTWYKDSKQVFASSKVQITENPYKLIIYGVNAEDSGYYGCTARNTFSFNTSEEKILIESGVYVSPDCTDNKYFANCALIVKGRYCSNEYYARFCCRSCTLAGQLNGRHPNSL